MQPPDLSILMLAHNRARQLPATFAALLRQTHPPARFELVLVDDGSEDETARVAAAFRPPFRYRCLRRANTNCRAAARNLALREARGEVALFLDAECVPPPSLVRDHVQRHLGRGARAVVGGFRFLAAPAPLAAVAEPARLWLLEQGGIPHLPRARPRVPPHFVTAHASCRLRDALAAGMFDEAFTGYGGEDLDLGQRLLQLGVRILSAPGLVVFHQPHPRAPRRDAEAAAAADFVLKKHAIPYRLLHLLDPADDAALAAALSSRLLARPLAQYRHTVVAAEPAARLLRRGGLRVIHPAARPRAEAAAHLLHRFSGSGGCPLGGEEWKNGSTGVHSSALPFLHSSPTSPSAPRQSLMDAMALKLRCDALLCGAQYPALAEGEVEGSGS